MPKKRKAQAGSSCEVQDLARRYLESIGLHGEYFDSAGDRCYCERCYPTSWPDSISEDGPTPYVVPRGWVRFGLEVPARGRAQDIFGKWSVSFHGVKDLDTLRSMNNSQGLGFCVFGKVVDKKTLNVIGISVVSFVSTAVPLLMAVLVPDAVAREGECALTELEASTIRAVMSNESCSYNMTLDAILAGPGH